VTTVTGEPHRRAEMASALCRHAGRPDVPVRAGCGEGLLTPMRQRECPQAVALGERDRQRAFEPNTALAFLRQTIRAHPGEVTLLAIGPLTNVGLLFAADPELGGLLRQLVLMCGCFFAPRPEWNAHGDVHATAITYGAGPQARPPRHVSFGLDVTTQCRMPADECRRRFAAPALELVRDFAEVWFDRGREVITFHDPLAAAAIFQPDLCTYGAGQVSVALDGPAEGFTVFRQDPAGPHTVATDVDAERFFEHYFETVGA